MKLNDTALCVVFIYRINMIAVLFARDDSRYKELDGYDVYDIHRDARNYCLSYPVLAHPPCRAWGQLSHMANPRPDEKQLAFFALAQVRLNGGVLEHPAGSRLWREANLPLEGEFPDEFGGFTIEVDQYDFGHVAHKKTKLYICGIAMRELPDLPPPNLAPTDRSICGNVKGTKRCTQYQREYTPDLLIEFITEICRRI
jgi:hypothetical protein